MRRNQTAILLAVLFCMVFIACNRYDRHRMKAYFFTTSNSSHNYHLYINGENKGRLPYQPGMIAVRSRVFKHGKRPPAAEALYVNLRSGRYMLKVKDETGETVYSEKFRLRMSGNSISISSDTRNERRARTKQETADGKMLKEIYFED